MADGLCSESDRKQFVATLINENVLSGSEKSGKCVNSLLQSRVQSASGESDRAETVKTRVSREQQNMTATGQQQQQSKKLLDAKSLKNKSALTMSSVGSQGMTEPQGGAGTAASSAGPAAAAVTAAAGGSEGVGVAVAGKPNNAPRALESEKIVPQKVKSVALQTTIGAGAANGPKLQQKKDSKSASAANVDMAVANCASEPGQQKQQQQQGQDTDDGPSAKKKRCSDRYDSSESSDSGVATLSCTDSSTASSDASDPGSPYSPVSLGEDANQSSTKANMPPQILSITQQNHRVHHSHQPHHQMTATPHQTTTHRQQPQMQHQTTTTVQHQWPWNVSSNCSTISNHNNNSSTNNNNIIANASNKCSNNSSVNSVLSGNSNANAKSKRISTVNPSDINGTAKKVRTSAASADRIQPQSGLTAAASKRLKAQQEDSPSQTKITGYFKSQMKPLKTPLKSDLGTLVARVATIDAQAVVTAGNQGALDKYLNAPANKTLSPTPQVGLKDEKDHPISQRKSVAIKKDFIDLPPLTQTMPPSLKKLERKPAKVAQVAPISRKTAIAQQLKSPKKHIAIAPRTTEMNQSQSQKPPTTNAFQIDQTKISQPTVLLTAIRIPPQTPTQTQQQLNTSGAVSQQVSTKAPPLTPTKMGSMLQIPVVPNLVQIPNLLTTTNGANLVVNNGQLARMGNGGQYFLNGTVLKLQQIPNGHSTNLSTTNGVLTMDSSALQGNILLKSPAAISQTIPTVTSSSPQKTSTLAIPQPIVTQPSVNGNGCHQAFITTTNQRIPTQSVLMATSSGWYVLNQPTADPISNNIPHQPTITTAMVCKSTRAAVTSLTNTICPPVPPLVTLASKLETTPTPGPKILTSATPTTTPPSADLKSKTPSHIDVIEPDKPLTVECPPLDPPLDDCGPTVILNHAKLESPKIVPSLTKSLSSPAIIAADKIGDVDIPTPSTTPKCAISPILSQPKTIRFPVPSGCEAGYRFGPKGIRRPDGVCYWDKCSEKYDTNSKLLDHLQTQHVNTQSGPFSCLWSGCKVRGRESCSRRWLERHVLSHGGTKPFKCIVDGCGLRLGSQLALQKHVNGHFNATENKDNPSKRASDPPVPKQLRKNGKKLRYRRQPFSARMFDFFDTGIMEGLQHRLLVTGSLATGSKGSITFQGRTMARRTNSSGITELYVKWSPSEIMPDEWVPESKGALSKTITIQSMQYQERLALQKYLHTTSHKSDTSIKTVSRIFPSAASNLSSLLGSSEGNNVTTTTTASCGRKQSRKPPKRNQLQPS